MKLLLGPKNSLFRWSLLSIAILGLLTATLPVIIIVIMSFSDTALLDFPPKGLSLQWYQKAVSVLYDNGETHVMSAYSTVKNSILISFITMIVTVLACMPLSYAMMRGNKHWRHLSEIFFTIPLIFPLVVLGVAYLLMIAAFSRQTGWDIGLWRIAIPHITLALPFVLRNCLSAMSGINAEIESAAVSLGASPLRAFWDIVIPLMRPGIIAGLIFAFIISFNEFTVTFFMYTMDLQTLPIWMFSRTASSLDPTILAISSLVIAIDIFLIVLVDKLVTGKGNLF